MNKQNLLDNIHIIMVNTTLPANIGSAARAMHTMGLQNLTVVNPKLPVDDNSYAHAAGATHLLDKINIVDTLEQAIANKQLVFAASSRNRHITRPVVNPTQAAQVMSEFLNSQPNNYSSGNNKIAILFGREDRGLTNEELALADYHIQIDANPNYPVLNVASAVQVISSFIYAYCQQNTEIYCSKDNNKHMLQTIRQDWDEPAISKQQQSDLVTKTIDMMQGLELADSKQLKNLPNRLQRLSSRLQLDTKEYQLLNAIIAKINKLTLK